MGKYLLATGALLAATITAQAADLKAPQPDYAPSASPWNAFYIGANFGAAFTRRHWTDAYFGETFDNGNNNNAVFLAGGQIGSNAQFGNFVIGFEFDIDWVGNTNSPGSSVVIPALRNTFQLSSTDAWISTLAGRFGVAFDCVLLYGKVGAGWVGGNGFTLTNVTTGVSIDAGGVSVTTGWLLGAGVEYAFLPNWTIKLEYDYLGLNNRNFLVQDTDNAPFPRLVGDTFLGSHRNLQMLKIGFNYLFTGPVVAKF
jgi:outer membrane immunogenic protein